MAALAQVHLGRTTGGVVSPTASVRATRAVTGPRLPASQGSGREPQLAARRAESMGLAISRGIVGRTEVRRARYQPARLRIWGSCDPGGRIEGSGRPDD